MRLKVSPKVEKKIWGKLDEQTGSPRGIRVSDVIECFENRCGGLLTDDRELHRTVPPTMWFIAETNHGRRLKIVFVQHEPPGELELKTAYSPSEGEEKTYAEA